MGTDLSRIRAYVERHPDEVMNSLYHHVYDVDNLRSCYKSLKGRRACGIDGVTKKAYGEYLDENAEALSQRLAMMRYRPKDKRRGYVPKGNDPKGRPLAISAFEDKIVEESMKRVLEAIYEPKFLNCSYGYRKERSPHKCLDALGKMIQQKRTNHVVEVDIRSFFDRLNHDTLLKFLEHRIGDKRILRIIVRMLKAGILEDGLVKPNEEGSAQGSIISPILSNVYLHYTLDLWFEQRVKKHCRGGAYLFRYADDFVAVFQFKDDAEWFEGAVRERLKKFHLSVADEKTKCLEFGRYAREHSKRRGDKNPEFTFLGFIHYLGRTKAGKFKVKRRTSIKKSHAKLEECRDWLKKVKSRKRTGEIVQHVKASLQGHLTYYAITDNSNLCHWFHWRITQLLFKWLNRRSQRKSYTWQGFEDMLEQVNWPKPKIRHNLCPFGYMQAAC